MKQKNKEKTRFNLDKTNFFLDFFVGKNKLANDNRINCSIDYNF